MDRKNSNTYLILYGLLLIFLCCLSYRTAIAPYNELKQQVNTIKSLNDSLATFSQRLASAVRHNNLQQTLEPVKDFASLVLLCQQHNVRIVKNRPVEIRGKSELKNILIVDFQGSYTDLIRVLSHIENSTVFGRLISATYRSYTDNQQKKRFLSLRTIFAQQQNITP